MFELITLPFSVLTVSLYITLYLFGNKTEILVATVILALIISLSLVQKELIVGIKTGFEGWRRSPLLWKVLTLAILAIMLIAIAYVLSPLVKVQTVNSFQFLQFPGIGDYHKHTYTLTAINQSGLPPAHPYFPEAKFSYYYGYYLIPAVFAKITNLSQLTSLYIFVLITTLVSLVSLARLYLEYIKNFWWHILAFSILIFGTALDILPTLIYSSRVFNRDINSYHIESWSYLNGAWLNVNNLYAAFLWVPQHVFAALISILVVNHLLREKNKLIFLIFSYTYVALSSIFVFMALMVFSLLIFMLRPGKRALLVKAGSAAALILVPFLYAILGNQGLLHFYLIQPFSFLSDSSPLGFITNFLVSIFSDYGIAFLGLVLFLIFYKYFRLTNITLLWLGGVASLLITFFIRSPGVNDFGMRFVLPMQLILPMLFVLSIQKIPNKITRILLLGFTLIFLVISGGGFIYEYSHRWKERKVFNYQDSEIISAIRGLPNDTKIAAIEASDWVFYAPSLGFKQVLAPYVFDAGVYLTSKDRKRYNDYSSLGFDLFINQQIAGDDLDTLINRENKRFSQAGEYFGRYQFDLLIVRHKVWVKKGVNPWVEIFKQMNISPLQLGSSFLGYPYQDLRRGVNGFQPKVKKEGVQIIIPADKRFALTGGLWLLASCSDSGTEIKLALEDYYALYERRFNSAEKGCVGNIFYLENNENLLMENNARVEKIYAFPIKIELIQ